MKQYGGGKCSLCGSQGTNKSTCPLNPNALSPDPDKHSMVPKSNTILPKNKALPLMPIVPKVIKVLPKKTDVRAPKGGNMTPIIFDDHPEFTPNVTPMEMFKLGVFGGSYFRPIHSAVVGKQLSQQHEEFRKLGWWEGIPDEMIASTSCVPSRNMYKVAAGSSLEDWESKGWIVEQDPYGWVQWYCRFYAGRRSIDDARQIDRWNKYTGPKSGRWRKNLINKLKAAGAKFDDPSISPVIRQGLLQWAYMLVPSDLRP